MSASESGRAVIQAAPRLVSSKFSETLHIGPLLAQKGSQTFVSTFTFPLPLQSHYCCILINKLGKNVKIFVVIDKIRY